MGSKPRKGDNGGSSGEDGKQMITDSRFSKAHTDPRFRRLPRRESKVTIDSRFKGVLTDKASAPVDKRGKRRRRGSAKDSLKEYYRIEEEDEKKKKNKKKQKRNEDSEDAESDEEELMALEAEARRRKSEQSSEEESDEEIKSENEKKLPLKLASSDEESDETEEEENGDVSEEEEDTDEDDEAMYEDDEPEVAEEEIASIEKETHRLAIVNMDWRYVSAKDLYVVFNSFLPKDGRLLSVAVYPSEFGLERMKAEEIHGPAIDGDKKNEDISDDDEEEEDEDVINERLRDYEKSRLKYYFAVAECDSSATADYLYKSCDGIEFERSSNKLDLRFIPDSMEFKHPARDIATEAPATYQGLDFQSQALQMCKVNVSWDEDEPHRVKTLNQKFNPDQLAELELKEFLASDESESDDGDDDDDDDDDEGKRKEKYRALMESGDVDSDKEEDEENDQDMEIQFNTGLEDLSNKFREKKETKSETVWDAQLRKMREKKKARRMQNKDDDDDDDDSSDDSDDDDDYNVDDHKKKKKKKKMMNKKNKKGLEEKLAADERSIAELELIVAAENGGDGSKGLKGYNIKGKGKKKSREMGEDKIPSADPDDQRFSAAFTDPNYALDPTNPQFKRSATYVKQLTQKQKEDPRSQEQVKDVASTRDGTVGSSKKRSFAESATVKSLKLKMQQKGSDKKKDGTLELAQRVKNKAKALSNK